MTTYEIHSAASTMSSWLDFIKLLTGTFVGAILALGANLLAQRFQSRAANRGAGNRALAIISRQYGDFVIFRAGLRQDIRERTVLPTWAQIRPTMFKMSESLSFDLSSLTFLVEHGKQELLGSLFLAETSYHDLRILIDQNSIDCSLRDNQLAAAGLTIFTPADIPRAEAAVDLALRDRLDSYREALLRRANNGVRRYRGPGEALKQFMTQEFGSKKVMSFVALGANPDVVNQDEPIT